MAPRSSSSASSRSSSSSSGLLSDSEGVGSKEEQKQARKECSSSVPALKQDEERVKSDDQSLVHEDSERGRDSPRQPTTARRERSHSGGRDRRRAGSRDRSGRDHAGRDRSRSRSGSEERNRYRHGQRYWGEYNRSPDTRRPSDRDRDDRSDRRGNSDVYWNKYGKGGRHSDSWHGSKDPENRDPNVGDQRVKTSRAHEDDRTVAPPEDTPVTKRAKKIVDEGPEALTLRTGGAYIPPARLRMMQAELTDKSSVAFQRFAWEALKKSINGLINKVNVANLKIITKELIKENIVRGRGLLARSIMQAQAASPTFTHVYAALVAVINHKFPRIGVLILTRLIIVFRRGFRRNDKNICLSATRFIAHLVNQQVAHEVVALEILTLLLENATDDSVEVAVGFLKECGSKLTEVSPRGVHAIFERLRSILHEGQLDKRVQYMIEVMFAIRKDGFKDHPSVIEELDQVAEEDQFTHLLSLDEVTDGQDLLNVFKHEPTYEENEDKYKDIRSELLTDDSGSETGCDSEEDGDEDDEDDDDDDEDDEGGADQAIVDSTETNLIALRRVIYLTIQSSLDFEECCHKMLKMELKPGQESELCHMILDCCAQQRTYEKFFGLLAQRFCQLNKCYVEPFERIFRDSYDTIHRLATDKLRNVAKVFAHLLFTDAISWNVLSQIKLNEEDTTSSSRIFIKVIFQELSEYMGLTKLNERVKDPSLQEAFAGLFPRDNPVNTRFAINFFTSIGLGGLTDELREHLKSMPKVTNLPPPKAESSERSSSSSSSSSSESDSDSSSSDDSSSDESAKNRRRSKKVPDKRDSRSDAKTISSSKAPSKPSSKRVTAKKRTRSSSTSSSSTSSSASSSSSTSTSSSSSDEEKVKKEESNRRRQKEERGERERANHEAKDMLRSTARRDQTHSAERRETLDSRKGLDRQDSRSQLLPKSQPSVERNERQRRDQGNKQRGEERSANQRRSREAPRRRRSSSMESREHGKGDQLGCGRMGTKR